MDNYGQQLQAYALQHYLREQGHDAYLIRFRAYSPPRPLWRRIGGAIKRRFFVSKEQKTEFRTLAQLYKRNTVLNRERKFTEFRERYLNSTERIYTTIDELQQNPPSADVYITGSDQVWHDSLKNKNNTAMYLDFGPSSVRRISYAASLGREIPQQEVGKFVSLLKHFDYISVREHKAQELLKGLGFPEVTVTIDPTLLLSPTLYDKIEGEEGLDLSKPYAFFYVLNIRSEAELYWNHIGKTLKEQGLEVKSVAASGYLPAREFIPGVRNIQATIPQWLSLVKNASVVFTTSFHGVVFCLLYHRSFYAILLTNENAKANDRLTSLLGICGLTRRIIANEHDSQNLDTTPINWDDVDARIAKMRQSSVNFLNQTLK